MGVSDIMPKFLLCNKCKMLIRMVTVGPLYHCHCKPPNVIGRVLNPQGIFARVFATDINASWIVGINFKALQGFVWVRL